MAHNIRVTERNGPSETITDKTNNIVRFKRVDNALIDENDPLLIPVGGSKFSFQKYLRGFFFELGETVANLRFYTEGTENYGDDVLLWAKTTPEYSPPVEETSTDGYTDAFSYTVSNPLLLGAGPYTGLGDIGDYLILAIEVKSTASDAAKLPIRLAAFAWDEL